MFTKCTNALNSKTFVLGVKYLDAKLNTENGVVGTIAVGVVHRYICLITANIKYGVVGTNQVLGWIGNEAECIKYAPPVDWWMSCEYYSGSTANHNEVSINNLGQIRFNQQQANVENKVSGAWISKTDD